MGEGRQKGGCCWCGGAPTCNVTPLLAIHAASGCNTVSALSGIGKTKLIKSAIKCEENICDALAVFNREEREQDTLLESGLSVIQALYCPKNPNVPYKDLRKWLLK